MLRPTADIWSMKSALKRNAELPDLPSDASHILKLPSSRAAYLSWSMPPPKKRSSTALRLATPKSGSQPGFCRPRALKSAQA